MNQTLQVQAMKDSATPRTVSQSGGNLKNAQHPPPHTHNSPNSPFPLCCSGRRTNDEREKTAVKSKERRCQSKRLTSSISGVPAPMTGNKTVSRGQRLSRPLVPNLGLQIRLDKMEGSGLCGGQQGRERGGKKQLLGVLLTRHLCSLLSSSGWKR